MNAKVFIAEAKSSAVLDTDGQDQGIITALVSVFNNVDLAGDRVMPGAFSDVVAAFDAGEKTIPVVWSHNTHSLDGFIGDVTALEETSDGLKATMSFDLNDKPAEKAYRLLKGGRVSQYSFAYRVLDSSKGADGANELTKLDVFEVGPTFYGANPETRTLDVKAGRMLSAANVAKIEDAIAAVTTAASALQTLLDAQSGDTTKSSIETTPPADQTTEGASPDDQVETDDLMKSIEALVGL